MMLRTAAILILSALMLCQGQDPKLSRITVYTNHNPSIILEYAERFLPEDEPVNEVVTTVFRSQLLSTGLFSDVRIERHPAETDSTRADVRVFPNWRPDAKSFVISEIVFDGFIGIDERRIRRALTRKGFAPGVRLLRYPLHTIKRFLDQSIEETYQSQPRVMHDFQAQLVAASFKIEPVAPQRFRFTICVEPGACR